MIVHSPLYLPPSKTKGVMNLLLCSSIIRIFIKICGHGKCCTCTAGSKLVLNFLYFDFLRKRPTSDKTVFFREFKSDNILAIQNCKNTKIRFSYLYNLEKSIHSSRFLRNAPLLLNFQTFFGFCFDLNTFRN